MAYTEQDCTFEATEVVITYLIPVYVVVSNDGSGPSVTRVAVDDGVSFDLGNRKCARNDRGELLPLGDRDVMEAIELIEKPRPQFEVEWPAWEFGW